MPSRSRQRTAWRCRWPPVYRQRRHACSQNGEYRPITAGNDSFIDRTLCRRRSRQIAWTSIPAGQAASQGAVQSRVSSGSQPAAPITFAGGFATTIGNLGRGSLTVSPTSTTHIPQERGALVVGHRKGWYLIPTSRHTDRIDCPASALTSAPSNSILTSPLPTVGAAPLAPARPLFPLDTTLVIAISGPFPRDGCQFSHQQSAISNLPKSVLGVACRILCQNRLPALES